MIKWPDRAAAAIRKLFEPLQDIDVYVEDIHDEPFYRCLLNHSTGGKVKVARVFGLGGRIAVLNAAVAHDQSVRRAVFIIDGDLPWIRGEPIPSVIGLHQHDAYCVENLLLCESAISLVLSQELAVTEKDATTKLGYSNWYESVRDPLTELFAAFATVSHFDPTIPTVSQGVGVMCVKKGAHTAIDAAKVLRAKQDAISAAERKHDVKTVTTLYQTLLARIQALPFPLQAVSGKDFLLPLLDFHLQSLGCRIKRKSLRVRLASAGEINRFARLGEFLAVAARGYR